MTRINAAIAIVQKGKRVLICQRKADDRFGNLWEFPGGKCEPGEMLEECLHRELREEVDIEVDIIGPLKPIHHCYPGMQLRLHPFLCWHRKGRPKRIECQKAIWIDPKRLPDYEFPPANESLILEVIQHFAVSGNLDR